MSAPSEIERIARELAAGRSCAGLAVEAFADGAGAKVRCSCETREPDLDPTVREFLDRAGPQDTGPGLERKLRVVRFGRDERGDFLVRFSPTTWELGRGFQMAVMANRAPIPAAREWLERAMSGEPITPGLAAVHGVVLTRNGELAMMRRAAGVLYRPLHWAATFEEQMVASDLLDEDGLSRAARRGLDEELGIAASDSRVEFLSPLIELETFNVAFLLVAHASKSSSELVEAAAAAADAREVERLAFVPARPDALRSLARSPGREFAPLHPTSALRLEILARYLESARP